MVVLCNIPDVASFYGCGPATIALLHYFAGANYLASVQLRKSIFKYFINYHTNLINKNNLSEKWE
jgi:hypothetical protein